MHLKPNLPKPQKSHLSAQDHDSHYPSAKASSRKKVIMPISSEAEIRAASVSHKLTSNVAATQTAKAPVNPHPTLPSTNKRAYLTPGLAARINSQIKLELLSSSLDAKNRRLKHTLAFLAKVLFWAAAAYVIIL